jgi:hypothetical protein
MRREHKIYKGRIINLCITRRLMGLGYKKENKIFLIYKEIPNGAVAKSYMTNGLLII